MREDALHFWATQAGAEVDLFWQRNGKNFAVQFKYGDAPRRTRSMSIALNDLPSLICRWSILVRKATRLMNV
jgi:hypothetical protein